MGGRCYKLGDMKLPVKPAMTAERSIKILNYPTGLGNAIAE